MRSTEKPTYISYFLNNIIMEKITLIILTIILSVNSFAQEPEDDDNFDSVTPVYFIDSVYIKYTIKNNIILRDANRNPEMIEQMTRENPTIRVASDEDISLLLTDTISKIYHATKKFSRKKQYKTIYDFFDNTAIDSNVNVLYVRVISPCEPCMPSILNNVLTDNDVNTLLLKGKLKYVYVNYYQTTMNKCYEFIVINFKHWFRKEQIYILYNEKI